MVPLSFGFPIALPHPNGRDLFGCDQLPSQRAGALRAQDSGNEMCWETRGGRDPGTGSGGPLRELKQR